MLNITLFGPGQVKFGENLLDGFPHQQACLLFSYLLLNRNYPHHRERLSSVFWGDTPTTTSRKHLRNNLWRLRQSLTALGVNPDDYLYISEESICWISCSPVWLDVEVFENATSECLSISEDRWTPEQVVRLEQAVELYTGDLLQSVYEDWCLEDRERLRLLFMAGLQKLMIFHTIQERYERALHYGNRILMLDGALEKVHRQLMWLYWKMGDRVAALQQFKRCTQILREDLGIRPMVETRRLFEQLLAGDLYASVWDNQRAIAIPRISETVKSGPSFTETALQKLQRLQDTIEETRAELVQLENLLNDGLVNSKIG